MQNFMYYQGWAEIIATNDEIRYNFMRIPILLLQNCLFVNEKFKVLFFSTFICRVFCPCQCSFHVPQPCHLRIPMGLDILRRKTLSQSRENTFPETLSICKRNFYMLQFPLRKTFNAHFFQHFTVKIRGALTKYLRNLYKTLQYMLFVSSFHSILTQFLGYFHFSNYFLHNRMKKSSTTYGCLHFFL